MGGSGDDDDGDDDDDYYDDERGKAEISKRKDFEEEGLAVDAIVKLTLVMAITIINRSRPV